jgi:hypothetical protein
VEVVELTSTNKNSQVNKVQIEVNKADKSISSWKTSKRRAGSNPTRGTSSVADVNVADNFFAFNAKQYPGVEVVDLR